MKVQLLSDLHLEAHAHWTPHAAPGAEVLVLAGDIGSYQAGSQLADSDFGLASYLFTRDLDRAMRVARGIEAGMCGVNTGLISTAVAPFGGVKQSGYGREGSIHGIDEYVEIKQATLALK